MHLSYPELEYPAKYDIRTDDKVTLVPDVNRIHIFDPETEEVICQ
ncbi:MAG: hypothetical protein ACI4KE_07800 [Anaerovoracaceae bacterium]